VTKRLPFGWMRASVTVMVAAPAGTADTIITPTRNVAAIAPFIHNPLPNPGRQLSRSPPEVQSAAWIHECAT
jgi:hypothetical protein